MIDSWPFDCQQQIKTPHIFLKVLFIMSMISSHITLIIQKYLRVWYSDPAVSILVFKHKMVGHYSVYLSSKNGSLYRNHMILYQTMETLLKMSGLLVFSLEVLALRPAPFAHSKATSLRSPPQTRYFELALDDLIDDESESNSWPLDDMDIWRSWI